MVYNIKPLSNHKMQKSICFQYSIEKDPYIQYGCIVLNKENEGHWQNYVQKSLQQYYRENDMLKTDEYMDIILYDSNVLVYDYKVELFSCSDNYFDYNLYIDTLNNRFVYNGTTRVMTNESD